MCVYTGVHTIPDSFSCQHGQKIYYQSHILHVAVKLNTLTLE